MKAIRVHAHGGPEVLRLEDLDVPQPASGQAVVQIAAAGLNFIDVYYRTGLNKPPSLPFTLGMEAAGTDQNGYFVPDRNLMYAAQVVTQELYPQFIATIRELAGGSLIMLPSSIRDLQNPELRKIIEKTQVSGAMSSHERVKFLKLAWDAVGGEFASRHLQYEMFYAGAQFVTCGHSFRTYKWPDATGLVDATLSRYAMAPAIGSL